MCALPSPRLPPPLPVPPQIFSAYERVALVRKMCSGLPVTVEVYDGLIVDCAKKHHADFLVRGLRAYSDFEYEFRMALVNRKLTGA